MDKLRLPRSDIDALRGIIRHGSLSFYAASRLLPADVRVSAFAIYAFCRMSDDTIDCAHAGESGLTMLRQRLDAAYAGRPFDTVVDRCFAEVVAHHRIPMAYPAGLLDGFAWDIDGRSYETLSDVRAYAARVAGTVGAMMSLLMGARSPAAIARASDLGTAMQLTNIARDVGEDAREGRLYLPEAWLRQHGLHPMKWLDAPCPHPAISSAVRRLLMEADRLYRRGLSGLVHLPPNCRPAIRAAGSIYREIGTEVARNEYDSVSQRAVVSGARKLQKLATALPLAFLGDRASTDPALTESAFLVDALPPSAAHRVNGPSGKLSPGATMLDLLLTLKARERQLLDANRTAP